MKNLNVIRDELQKGMYDGRFKDVYVDEGFVSYNRERYVDALDKFRELFGEKKVGLYSAPGRSEVCGNHTDHQNGHVLAASINLDAIAVAAPVTEGKVRLKSGDSPMIEMDIYDLEKKEEEKETTESLIRGVAAGLQRMGYRTGGLSLCDKRRAHGGGNVFFRRF